MILSQDRSIGTYEPAAGLEVDPLFPGILNTLCYTYNQVPRPSRVDPLSKMKTHKIFQAGTSALMTTSMWKSNASFDNV